MARARRWPPGSARRGRRGAAGVRRWGGRGARRWRPRRWPGAADLQPRWVRRLAAGRAPRCAPPCPCWRARRAAAPAPRPRRRGRPPGAPADPGGPTRRLALRAPPKAPSAARSPPRAAQPGPPWRPWFRRAHSLSSRRGGKVGRCSRRRFRPQDGSDRKPAREDSRACDSVIRRSYDVRARADVRVVRRTTSGTHGPRRRGFVRRFRSER